MRIELDGKKSDACFRERGFDFEYAAHVFLDPNRIIKEDSRHEYGERRFNVLGLIENRLFTVTYTKRKANLRIISARKANQRKVKRYEKSKT